MNPKLRITVDAGTIAYHKRTGIGRYLENVLPRMIDQAGTDAEWILLSGRPFENEIAKQLLKRANVSSLIGNFPSFYAWQQSIMTWAVRMAKADVHFTPDGLLPPFLPCPSVGVCFDLIWKRYPKTASWHIKAVFALRQKASLGKLTTALTSSDFTKNDLIKEYGATGERVQVIPCGVDSTVFHPKLSSKEVEPYFLCVGNLMPHKNLQTVFQAYDQLIRNGVSVPKLLVVGAGKGTEIKRVCKKAKRSICFAGYIEDEDLRSLYRHAEALIFPSLYEGYGLPILEAMASGVPVLHSDAASLPEVANEFGTAFDPSSIESVRGAIEHLVYFPNQYTQKTQSALEYAQTMTWDQTAAKTLDAIFKSTK